MSKKYVPSVKANNELKEAAVKELQAVIYKLEKGVFNGSLEKETIDAIAKELRAATEGLEYALGTGDENVYAISTDVKQQLKEFKKQLDQTLTGRIESAAEELIYSLTLWKDVVDGNAVLDTEEDVKVAKVSRSRKKLDGRLAELDEIKKAFSDNAKRLEKEIASEERDLNEMEEQMLAEENERKINDLYRRIKATRSKIDMLTVRQSNYAACFGLLDMIYANAREILHASNIAADEIAKVKVLLNIGKLRQVLNEPDKAISILKRMDQDVKNVAAKTTVIDEKVFSFDNGNAVVNEDALKYKEELMRKKREKEGLAQTVSADAADAPKTAKTIKEEN